MFRNLKINRVYDILKRVQKMDEIMRTYANDVKRFCMSLCHDEQMA